MYMCVSTIYNKKYKKKKKQMLEMELKNDSNLNYYPSTSPQATVAALNHLLKSDFLQRQSNGPDSNDANRILTARQVAESLPETKFKNGSQQDCNEYFCYIMDRISQIPYLCSIIKRQKQILMKNVNCYYSPNGTLLYKNDIPETCMDIKLTLPNNDNNNNSSYSGTNTRDIYDALTFATRIESINSNHTAQNRFLRFGDCIDIVIVRNIYGTKASKNLQTLKLYQYINFGKYKNDPNITQREFDILKRNDIFEEITNPNYPNNNGQNINDMYQCTSVSVHCGTGTDKTRGGHYINYNYDGEIDEWIKFDDDKVCMVDWMTVLANSMGNDAKNANPWNCPTAIRCTYKRVCRAETTKADVDNVIQRLLNTSV